MGCVQDDVEEAVGKKWKVVIGVIVGIIAIYIGFSLVFSFWPFSSAAGVVQKVTSPDAIIGNYEYFYDMEKQIDATQIKVTIAKEAMENAKGTPDYSTRSTEYTGVKMVLASMIGEYNARSKQITRNLWKAKDLPYQIEMEVK